MVIDLTSSPIKKDLEHGSDNDLQKEDEVGFFCSLFLLHTQAKLVWFRESDDLCTLI